MVDASKPGPHDQAIIDLLAGAPYPLLIGQVAAHLGIVRIIAARSLQRLADAGRIGTESIIFVRGKFTAYKKL